MRSSQRELLTTCAARALRVQPGRAAGRLRHASRLGVRLGSFSSGGPWAGFEAARVLGAACTIATAFVVSALFKRSVNFKGAAEKRIPWQFLLAVAGLWLANLPLGAWASSGMETPVVMLLCTLATWGCIEDKVWGYGFAGIAAGLRPELVPWSLVLGVSNLIAQSLTTSASATPWFRRFALALLVITPPIAVALIRWLTFGSPDATRRARQTLGCGKWACLPARRIDAGGDPGAFGWFSHLEKGVGQTEVRGIVVVRPLLGSGCGGRRLDEPVSTVHPRSSKHVVARRTAHDASTVASPTRQVRTRLCPECNSLRQFGSSFEPGGHCPQGTHRRRSPSGLQRVDTWRHSTWAGLG